MPMAAQQDHNELLDRLPRVRGKIRLHADLSKGNWFQVGGPAEILFRPEDEEDLAYFLENKPENLPYMVLGVGSNLIIRDGGIDGVVIRLGRGFVPCHALDSSRIKVGAACLSFNAATIAQQNGIAGLEFLTGIPGSIGGVLRMNGGAYGSEIKDVLVEAYALDPQGKRCVLKPQHLHYRYRHSDFPEGWIFTGALLQGAEGDPEVIAARIDEISKARESTQPIRAKTGGSTFKNPEGYKAWQLIDAAGCRGLSIGGAQISEKHCNFMINTGNAVASDLEKLGEEVIKRVFAHSGVMLEWEIKRVGK
jgi:UDP-N-acetylmuramate dehydrogenase